MRSLAVAVLLAFTASPALAERLRTEYVPAKIDPSRSIGAVVNSKTIFLNRCTGGCKVYNGFTDSRTNKSGIGQGTLSAFEHGNSSWTQVVDCAKDVFKRFNVTITDVDPGPNVDHFEIMVAGSPGQIGLSSGIGGIAEYSCTSPGVCSKYLPNALVFAFANVYANDPDEICGTVAQEIAHTWSLDHVTDASDPMTYFSYSGRRQFKDGVACGSDCVNGSSPFGLTCSGNNHTCMSTGTSTQNDVAILMALFGPAGAVSPTLTLKEPSQGAAVGPAFTVSADCTGSRPIQEVQLSIDGQLKATLTAPPFTFTTSSSLTEGPHKVTVLCATDQQAIATKTVDVILGNPCTGDSQCMAGYICFDSACIAGPDAPGGLGATCVGNTDCKAGSCASDGEISACTIPCDLNNKNCPSGFGCLQAGEVGVCWAGFDDGSGGCCDTGGNGPASMVLALGIGGVLLRRRRRHARR
jgi:uncharacterized protein (TIGR03382 family)